MCGSSRTSLKGQSSFRGAPTLRAPLAELRADAVETVGGTLADMEREYIIRVLARPVAWSAPRPTRLGVPRTTLNAMMRKLGISRQGLFMMYASKLRSIIAMIVASAAVSAQSDLLQSNLRIAPAHQTPARSWSHRLPRHSGTGRRVSITRISSETRVGAETCVAALNRRMSRS